MIIGAELAIIRRVPSLTTTKNEKFIGATCCTCGTGLHFDCNDGTQGRGGTPSSIGAIIHTLDESEPIGGEFKTFNLMVFVSLVDEFRRTKSNCFINGLHGSEDIKLLCWWEKHP